MSAKPIDEDPSHRYAPLVTLARDLAHPGPGSPYAGPDARTKLAAALADLGEDQ